jgi:hypothetical protein
MRLQIMLSKKLGQGLDLFVVSNLLVVTQLAFEKNIDEIRCFWLRSLCRDCDYTVGISEHFFLVLLHSWLVHGSRLVYKLWQIRLDGRQFFARCC